MRAISQISGRMGYSRNLRRNDYVEIRTTPRLLLRTYIRTWLLNADAMDEGASSFAQAVSYSLKRLGTPMLTLKNEQLSAI